MVTGATAILGCGLAAGCGDSSTPSVSPPLHLFGPPADQRATARGRCVYYRVVGMSNGWQFCFAHGLMASAAGNFPLARFEAITQADGG